jgi:hypothetical protein
VRKIITILFWFLALHAFSQDSTYLKVHFLYGSKPVKKYKQTEPKWFGGKKGGHVGIEGDSDRIVSFVRKEKFHWFSKSGDRHSTYMVHSACRFYAILGGNSDSVKKAVVYIPVSRKQKQKFDSISTVYLHQTPYDYALFGMRCAAAAYDILGQLNIVTSYKNSKTYKKIFYPKKLRKRLFKMAHKNGWLVTKTQGSIRRKWERD